MSCFSCHFPRFLSFVALKVSKSPGFFWEQLSNEKNLGWLFDIGDYTTQLYGD